MGTLKSLIDATIKAGSKFALVNASGTAVEFPVAVGDYSESSQTVFIPPSDGYLVVRGSWDDAYSASTTEIRIYGGMYAALDSYTHAITWGGASLCTPVRKGKKYRMFCRTAAGTGLFYANDS